MTAEQTAPGQGAPPSRTDWITAEIRNAILRGDFTPGEQLRSSTIGERWSISQTPIREAFQRLAAEGLVVHSSQRGVRVPPVSLQDIEEVYELRLLLEPIALRRSLERGDESWLAEVRAAHAELCTWDGTGAADLSGYEQPHRRFHAAVVAGCDSEWLLRIVHMLAQQSSRYRPLAWAARGGLPPDPHEHDALLTACVRRDADRVVRLCTQHLRATYDAARSQLAPATPVRRRPAGTLTSRHTPKAPRSPARR
jgi:DNA-binding GntR family transcriptional regulator